MQSNSFISSFQQFLAKNKGQFAAIMAVFLLAGMFMELSVNQDGRADVLSSSKPAAFDGLVAPVLKSPDWVALTAPEFRAAYDQIPAEKLMAFPIYNADNLKIPTTTLSWSGQDKQIRNEKITFSTPYMGNYKLDGVENAGSHLAVDIKVPHGTPVYAIGNGVVVTASNQSSGFGNHVVIKHVDFPSFENSSVLTNYYSSYSHMSDVMVSQGQVVTKGQLIGKSGSTGTATTPHVHFQIDKESAPFHPYWPFTYLEASQAGYNFTTSINAGFGKEKALAHSINPFMYVQKYNGSKGNALIPALIPAPLPSSSSVITPSVKNPISDLPPVLPNTAVPPQIPVVAQPPVVAPVVIIPPAVVAPSSPVIETPVNNVAVENPPVVPSVEELSVDKPSVAAPEAVVSAFKIKMQKSFVINIPQTIIIYALDSEGKSIKSYRPVNPVYVKIENGSAKLSNNYIEGKDFVNGEAQIELTPFAQFGIRISVTNGKISTLSDFIQNSNFADINEKDKSYVAVNFLKNRKVISGYPDGQFHPEGKISRVEALKMIYEGYNMPLQNSTALRFKDTDSKAWYAQYIASAVNDGIARGYPGSLFKPAHSVTRAEFVKMLLEASNSEVEMGGIIEKPFEDVNLQDWYSEYVAFAKSKKILDTSMNKFFPNKELTRGDAADMLYRSVLLEVSKRPYFTDGLVVSNESLDKFFMN